MALKALPQIQKHSDKTGGAAAHTDPPPTHPHRPGGSSVLTGGGSPAQTASSPTITRRRHRTTTWVLPSESPQPQPQPQPLSPCAQPHVLVMRSRTAWCCPRGGGCATAHPCAVSTQPWELCSEQGHPLRAVAQRSARDAPSALTVAQRPPNAHPVPESLRPQRSSHHLDTAALLLLVAKSQTMGAHSTWSRRSLPRTVMTGLARGGTAT